MDRANHVAPSQTPTPEHWRIGLGVPCLLIGIWLLRPEVTKVTLRVRAILPHVRSALALTIELALAAMVTLLFLLAAGSPQLSETA